MAKKKVTPERIEAAERQLKDLQRQVENNWNYVVLQQNKNKK